MVTKSNISELSESKLINSKLNSNVDEKNKNSSNKINNFFLDSIKISNFNENIYSKYNIPKFDLLNHNKNLLINENNFNGFKVLKKLREDDLNTYKFDEEEWESESEFINIDNNIKQIKKIKILKNKNYKKIKIEKNKIDKIKFLKNGKIKKFNNIINLSQILKEKEIKQYKCYFCDKIYSKPGSLGGHISRSHRGRSKHYKLLKMKKRINKLENDRKKYFGS